MNNDVKYEKSDASVKAIILSGVILFIIVGIIVWLMIPFYRFVQRTTYPKSVAPIYEIEPIIQSPSPTLEVHPSFLLKEHQKEMDAKVNSYGWVDKENKIAHIPIDRAIELSLEAGFDTGEKK